MLLYAIGGYKEFELYATLQQMEIRDHIQRLAEIENIPPSQMEDIMIENGKINEDWDI